MSKTDSEESFLQTMHYLGKVDIKLMLVSRLCILVCKVHIYEVMLL